jgi:hypothetical protein
MKKKLFLITLVIAFALSTSSAAFAVFHIIRYDGPYKGKVIDADTGKPIEGAVVLGVWYWLASVGGGGGFSKYYDTQESVTNMDGEFVIKGLGLKILTTIDSMNVLIFKAGYKYIGPGPWESFKLDGGLLNKKITWEGNKAIIPLRKLSMEDTTAGGSPTSRDSSSPSSTRWAARKGCCFRRGNGPRRSPGASIGATCRATS